MQLEGYHPLTKEEIRLIHNTSINILEEVGINIQHDEALSLLESHGALVEKEKRIAKIPEGLLKEKLKQVPDEFKLVGRDSKYSFIVDQYSTFFASGDPKNLVSSDGNIKKTRKKDKEDVIRLLDALENVNFVGLPQFSDLPPVEMERTSLTIGFTNTMKPIVSYLTGGPGAREAIKVAATVAGDLKTLQREPNFFYSCACLNPLRWGQPAIEIIKELSINMIPNGVCSYPMLGVNAPITLAGGLALANAEVLSGIVLIQLFNSGAPCAYWIGGGPFNMKTAQPRTGSPGVHLISMANAQLARYYGLPSMSWAETDSKVPDTQSGIEKALSLFLQQKSGNNIIWGLGSLGSDFVGCPEQAIIDDEIIRINRAIIDGIEVNEETLALKEIKTAGIGGNYILLDQTRSLAHKPRFESKLSDAHSRHNWLNNGAKDMVSRAKEKITSILESHVVPPLSNEIIAELTTNNK